MLALHLQRGCRKRLEYKRMLISIIVFFQIAKNIDEFLIFLKTI